VDEDIDAFWGVLLLLMCGALERLILSVLCMEAVLLLGDRMLVNATCGIDAARVPWSLGTGAPCSRNQATVHIHTCTTDLHNHLHAWSIVRSTVSRPCKGDLCSCKQVTKVGRGKHCNSKLVQGSVTMNRMAPD
jgi:hypothetical protein